MTANVISHHRPCRKHANAWAYPARGLGALALTVAALAAASWLAPQMLPAPTVKGASLAPPRWAAGPAQDADVTLDLVSQPSRPAARRLRRARPDIPLTTASNAAPDGFEILSAAELDAISQARD